MIEFTGLRAYRKMCERVWILKNAVMVAATTDIERGDNVFKDYYKRMVSNGITPANARHEKAIEFLSHYHKKHPWNIDFQHVILDALFALGKNEISSGSRSP